MITVYGSPGCGRCELIKRKLDDKEIEYSYVMFNELPDEKQENIIKKAREVGFSSFPIVVDEKGIIFEKMEEI